MRNNHTIAVIIPALNEENAIGLVIGDTPQWVDRIIVVDNGSKDQTANIAKDLGASVFKETQAGYGAACLKGIAEALKPIADETRPPDIIVFLDGDYSDYPEHMGQLVDPVIKGFADLVIGSRAKGMAHKGSLTPVQVFGNWFACGLMNLIWKTNYSDLGPFRAIRSSSLQSLHMQDQNFGWTIEMQIKAHLKGLKIKEVPINYRARIGISKISGTIKGSLMAGTIILTTIGRYWWQDLWQPGEDRHSVK